MLRKSTAEGRKRPAPGNSLFGNPSIRTDEAQEAVISSFALERRAGWDVSRRTNRPINLERRARFARIESL